VQAELIEKEKQLKAFQQKIIQNSKTPEQIIAAKESPAYVTLANRIKELKALRDASRASLFSSRASTASASSAETGTDSPIPPSSSP
jgi:hypothetical protein